MFIFHLVSGLFTCATASSSWPAHAACQSLQVAELEALAGKALKASLAEDRYSFGVVIDSLSSQYLTPDQAAQLLFSTLGLQKTCKPSGNT